MCSVCSVQGGALLVCMLSMLAGGAVEWYRLRLFAQGRVLTAQARLIACCCPPSPCAVRLTPYSSGTIKGRGGVTQSVPVDSRRAVVAGPCHH